jgi:hypothetical protein
MNDIKFNFVFLGQSVLRYEVPLEIFHTINAIYESNFTQLAPANKQLVGKIKTNTLSIMMEKTHLKCTDIVYYLKCTTMVYEYVSTLFKLE